MAMVQQTTVAPQRASTASRAEKCRRRADRRGGATCDASAAARRKMTQHDDSVVDRRGRRPLPALGLAGVDVRDLTRPCVSVVA